MSKPILTQDELDNLLAQIGPSITLEALQAIHDQERARACHELDEMAKQFAREDAQRKKLWGNKFPRVLGAKPPSDGKSINQVKGKKSKTRRTSDKAHEPGTPPVTRKKS